MEKNIRVTYQILEQQDREVLLRKRASKLTSSKIGGRGRKRHKQFNELNDQPLNRPITRSFTNGHNSVWPIIRLDKFKKSIGVFCFGFHIEATKAITGIVCRRSYIP